MEDVCEFDYKRFIELAALVESGNATRAQLGEFYELLACDGISEETRKGASFVFRPTQSMPMR